MKLEAKIEALAKIAKSVGINYHKPTPEEIQKGSYYQCEPDWFHDRNAIVELINKLWREKLNDKGEPALESESFLVRFEEECWKICKDDVEWSITPVHRYVLMTAEQLSDALIKAFGMWEE